MQLTKNLIVASALLGSASAFVSKPLARPILAATVLSFASVASSAEEWHPVKGIKTLKTTVKEARSGAPTVEKGDTVTVHATGATLHP